MDRAHAGGILDLWRRVSKRLPEVVEDFRTIYHCSLFDVELREAFILVRRLGANPLSALTAAEQGWERPVSYEWLLLADLYDMQRQKASKRRSRPYPRPTTKRTRIGGQNTVKRSRAEVSAILRPHREHPPD